LENLNEKGVDWIKLPQDKVSKIIQPLVLNLLNTMPAFKLTQNLRRPLKYGITILFEN
jgi:hypothetical protein